jgi:hypothetical protein
MAITARADDGLVLINRNSWKVFIIPQTRFVLITDEAAWKRIASYHIPYRPAGDVLGIAIKDKDAEGQTRYTILMPLTIDAFDTANLFQEVIGHEVLHVVDYYLGYPLFDPDRFSK